MVEVVVIILTYRRPELLLRSVESLRTQRGVSDPVEILVVDNDVSESARAAVQSVSQEKGWPIRYVSEPKPGISNARNAGVSASRSTYIAFLDDDEEANPDWLASLLATARRSTADIVVGPVLPRFPEEAAVPAYARRIYTRDLGLPSGSTIRWGGIGNSLLLRQRCFAGAEPFDPRLGLTGGEDSVFLQRLVQEGRRVIWCAEAWVAESVPAEKLTAGYLLRRAFRTGQTTAFQPSALARPQWGAVLRWMVIGVGQAIVYAPLGLLLALLGRPEWLSMLARASSGLGKTLWHPALHLRTYRLPVRRRVSSRSLE